MEGTHHPTRHSNLKAYKPFTHQHIPEVEQILERLAGKKALKLSLVPISGPFARGIYAVCQVDLPKGQLSGLIDAERVLKRIKGIAFTRFSSADVVRHPLVARIVDAYDAQGSAALRAGITTRRKPLPTDD